MFFALSVYFILLIFGTVMYILSMRKPKDEEYVWAGHGKDPFKDDPILRD